MKFVNPIVVHVFATPRRLAGSLHFSPIQFASGELEVGACSVAPHRPADPASFRRDSHGVDLKHLRRG
jgi:hypothetical protein